MRICVIPARGGSKRIPRKNIRPFAGKPMIAHSIEAAIRSDLFDRVVVSTDDDEIADVARQFGAETPFKRPANLSNDFAGTHEVIGHAVGWLKEHGAPSTHACCIYATAPLIDAADVRRGYEVLTSGPWDSVVAATTFAFPIFRAITRNPGGSVRMFHPEHYRTRSQDLPEALHDAGQFYWARSEVWMAPGRGFTDTTTVVVLPRWRVQDIDTPEDWERAELLYRVVQEGQAGQTR
jgi:pseudaminic acid cytidylyltransferase